MAMSAYSNVPYIAILIAFSIAVYTDVRTRKIPNGIPLALALSALAYQASQGFFSCINQYRRYAVCNGYRAFSSSHEAGSVAEI